jgi:2-dehydropantoate 2-reductase
VLGGVTAINAALLPDGTIQQSQLRVSMNIIGELDGAVTPRCREIQAALGAGGIPADISNNIMASLWLKFCAFAGIATIASLTRSRAGAIARAPGSAGFISCILDECARIAGAEGFAPPPEIFTTVRGMFSNAESTYGPSILIDMENGRPTEGEHTVGDLADRAARHGIDAPILTAARCNLQAYEINRLAERR